MLAPSADHPPAGLFLADGDGRILFVNDRWCEITGLPAAEAKGDGWQRIIHPEEREPLVKAWVDAVKARRPFKGQSRYLRPDGRVVWFEADGSPINNPATGEAAYVGSCTDITSRRLDEARTRLYDALLSNNPDFAYVFDTGYRFIYANQALLTMWGRTPEEAFGKRCAELGYPDWHAAMHEREIDTVIETRRPISGEVPFHGTHGRRLYEYIFSPIIGGDGKVEAIAGVTRDVTDRANAGERANFLGELSGRLMALATEREIITEAVSLLGRHLNVQRCYFIECLKEENLLRVCPDWHRAGEASIAGDYPIDSFGGEAWWSEYSAGPLVVEDVETHPLTSLSFGSYLEVGVRSYVTRPYRRIGPWSVVLAVTEGSPRQWTEEESMILDSVAARVWPLVEQARGIESLRESDRRKDQFLATLAHELRNPLAPVLTGLEIMKQAKGDAAIIDHITDIIGRQTRQMAHLIDDLLDISRVNTGKIVLKPEAVPFARILGNAIEASQPLFEERRHCLITHLPPESTIVSVDPSRISQVVSNLLSNAAKYTPQGGRIILDSGVSGDGAWIRVTDNGQGIPAEEQGAIFELFHQTKDGSADGLGIGLTLVRSLVGMHGGSVTVRSQGTGTGSEFEILLPSCVVSHATSSGEDGNHQLPATKRALVVDDGKSNADMLAMFLQLEGMQVETAYNGLEGLEKARAFRPDFVIMDIGMPVMDGLEAAALMRAEKLGATLIALSGWGREEDRKRTAEAGFDHHLTKPVTPADLRRILGGAEAVAG